MNTKKLIKNIGLILILLVVAILTEKLSAGCLSQAKASYSMTYSYLALACSIVGYAAIGFILGLDSSKEEKTGVDYARIIGAAIPSLIIGLIPLIYLIAFKSNIGISFNIFFLIFGLQLAKAIKK